MNESLTIDQLMEKLVTLKVNFGGDCKVMVDYPVDGEPQGVAYCQGKLTSVNSTKTDSGEPCLLFEVN